MAYQLVYTSAAKLLDAGRSGFGTVARSRAIPPLIVSAIERVSQFANLRGLDRSRVIYVHRRIIAGNNRFHILSRIADAGADYTGRTNHLAHHLVVPQNEAVLAAAFNITPADVLQQFTWLKDKAWEGSPRFFTDDDEIPLEQFTAMGLNCTQGAWSKIANNPAHAYLLAGDDAPRTCVLITPDTVAATDRVYALDLLAEALAKFKGQSWSRTFTTSLETTDELSDLDWIVTTPASYPEIQSRCSSRQPYDLTDIEWLRNWSPPELSASDSRPGSSATSGANAPIIGKSNTRIPAPDVATPSYRPYSNMDRLEDTRSKVMSKSQRRTKQSRDRTSKIMVAAKAALIVIVALLVVAFLIGNQRNQAKIHSTQSPTQPAAETKPTPDATHPLQTDNAEGTSDGQVPAPPKEKPIAHQTPENNSTKDPPSANPYNAGNTGEKPPAAVEAIKAPPRQVILVTRKELETGVKVELIRTLMVTATAGKTPKSIELKDLKIFAGKSSEPENTNMLLTEKGKDYYCRSLMDNTKDAPKYYIDGTFSLVRNNVMTVSFSDPQNKAWIVVDEKQAEKKENPIIPDLKFSIQESGDTFKLTGSLADWIRSVNNETNDLQNLQLSINLLPDRFPVSIKEATIQNQILPNSPRPTDGKQIFPLNDVERTKLQQVLENISRMNGNELTEDKCKNLMITLEVTIGMSFASKIPVIDDPGPGNKIDSWEACGRIIKNLKDPYSIESTLFPKYQEGWKKASEELEKLKEPWQRLSDNLKAAKGALKIAQEKLLKAKADFDDKENLLNNAKTELKEAQNELKSAEDENPVQVDKVKGKRDKVNQIKNKITDINSLPQTIKNLEATINHQEFTIKTLEKDVPIEKNKIVAAESKISNNITNQRKLFFASIGKSILMHRKLFGLSDFDNYENIFGPESIYKDEKTIKTAIEFCNLFIKWPKTGLPDRRKAYLDKIKTLRVQTEGGRVLFEAKKE